jgi:hypothetical protein
MIEPAAASITSDSLVRRTIGLPVVGDVLVVAVLAVFGLVDEAVEHRREHRYLGPVGVVGLVGLSFVEPGFRRQREQKEEAELTAHRRGQLEPLPLILVRKLDRRQVSKGGVALSWIRQVVEGEAVARPLRLAGQQRLHGRKRRQRLTSALAVFDQGMEIASVVFPRVIGVVVAQRPAGRQRIG